MTDKCKVQARNELANNIMLATAVHLKKKLKMENKMELDKQIAELFDKVIAKYELEMNEAKYKARVADELNFNIERGISSYNKAQFRNMMCDLKDVKEATLKIIDISCG